MHPTLLRVHGAPIASYGVLVASGYLAGILFLMSKVRELKGTYGEFWTLVYCIFFGAIAGAKLGFLFVERADFLADPGRMLGNWRFGWVFWSGFAGTMLMGWLFQQVYNRLYRPRRYLPVADYFATALPLGHALGRVGCFLEGCCYGRPTAMPWGVTFTNPASSVPEWLLGTPLHPTQIYEAAGELAIFLFLLLHVLPGIRGKRFAYGTAFFGYIVLYSALRFSVECFRGDDRGAFLWPILSPSQWASLGGLLLGGGLLLRRGVLETAASRRSIYLE